MLVTSAAVVLTLIAIAHSVLGERELLRPLFRAKWDVGVPRWAAERIFRFAWHLTSVAWLGLAAALLGVSAVDATALVCVSSGAIIFFTLRGHLAWPLFFFAAAAAWASTDALPSELVATTVVASVMATAIGAVVHLYWAMGGRRGLAVAVPQDRDGQPLFRPGPRTCSVVAIGCLAYGALLTWVLYRPAPPWLLGGLGMAALALAVRAAGDGRYAGFTKIHRETAFARADDAVYTPVFTLCFFGALAALHLGVS